MATWLDAFLPAFGLLALGALLRAALLTEEVVWAGMERLVFWVLLPALLVSAISAVPIRELPVGGMAVAIWGGIGFGTLASVLLARALGHGHAAMTSVLQGGIRFNTMLAFAVATGLWGERALALGGVSAALIVPAVQVVITIAFVAGGGGRLRPLALLRGLLLNPLLLACLAGFAVSAAGGLPPGVRPLLSVLGQATVAIGLLCVGAALSPRVLVSGLGTIGATGVLKLLAVPGATGLLAAAIGLDPLATGLAVMFMAMPTATTAYVQARAMGGDAPLMAALITWQHLAAVLTLPLWALLLQGG
ncbi:MAG: AEC family transporter [Acetobacteraceae bacterium]|nr:AEC family transporter [Acetobacteraceae bacterium]